jgi:hypothetical protein
MSERFQQHSQSWVTFSYASFLGACALVGGGILFVDIDLWVRAYLFIGMVMIVQASINMTKTLRDNFEADQLVRRIEDARTEKLLKEASVDVAQ